MIKREQEKITASRNMPLFLSSTLRIFCQFFCWILSKRNREQTFFMAPFKDIVRLLVFEVGKTGFIFRPL